MKPRKMFVTLLCLTLMPRVTLATDLVDNLISVWKLDEANSDALDAHGLNKLTQGGTVGTATGKVYATARSFERANAERFSIADNATLSGGSGVSFTMGAWVKFATDPGAGQYMMIFAKDDAIGGEREFYLGWHGDTDKFHFQTWNADGSGGAVNVATATTVTTGVWYFVQAGFDDATDKIWIRLDGSAPVTDTQTVIYDGSAPFRIGASSGATPTHGWNGEIGPAFFYRRYVSGGELLQHYNENLGLVYDAYGVNVSHWLAKAAATPSVPGVPEIDVTHITGQTATVATTPIDANVTKFGGGNGVFSNGRPEVNATHFGGSALTQSGGRPEVNTTHISGGLAAADNAESFFDGGGYGPLAFRTAETTVQSQTVIDLAGEFVQADALVGATIGLIDVSAGVLQRRSICYRTIIDTANDGSGGLRITIDSAPTFMFANGDIIEILPPGFATVDRADLAAVKAKTGQLTFSVANKVDGNTTHFGGTAGTFSGGRPEVNTTHLSGDLAAADNAESFFDGEGYGPLAFRAAISTVNSQTEFEFDGAFAYADALVGATIGIIDAGAGVLQRRSISYRTIIDSANDGSGNLTITIDSAPTFTLAPGDIVEILPP
jgi:hypothetical protein